MFEIFPNLLKIENQEITFMLCSQPFLIFLIEIKHGFFKNDEKFPFKKSYGNCSSKHVLLGHKEKAEKPIMI